MAGFDAVACDYSREALAYGEEHYQIPTIQSPAECIDAEDQSFDIVTVKGGKYYRFANVLYSPVMVNGEVAYKVVAN